MIAVLDWAAVVHRLKSVSTLAFGKPCTDEAIAAVALHGSLHSLNVNSIPGIGLSTIQALATATRYASSCVPCGMLGVMVTASSYWLKGGHCLVHVCSFQPTASIRGGCICLMSSSDLLLVVGRLQQLGKSCIGTDSLGDMLRSIQPA